MTDQTQAAVTVAAAVTDNASTAVDAAGSPLVVSQAQVDPTAPAGVVPVTVVSDIAPAFEAAIAALRAEMDTKFTAAKAASDIELQEALSLVETALEPIRTQSADLAKRLDQIDLDGLKPLRESVDVITKAVDDLANKLENPIATVSPATNVTATTDGIDLAARITKMEHKLRLM
jgi:hypothetical protein